MCHIHGDMIIQINIIVASRSRENLLWDILSNKDIAPGLANWMIPC